MPSAALSTPIILKVPIPDTGPVDVVAIPTEVTSINSSANFRWSPRFISAVELTQKSVVVVDIPLPALFTKVVVTGVNDIGDCMIPSITKTLFSVRLAIVKRCELPAPTFVNVTGDPPDVVRSLNVLLLSFWTNTVVGKFDPPVICNAVAPTPANVDNGV